MVHCVYVDVDRGSNSIGSGCCSGEIEIIGERIFKSLRAGSSCSCTGARVGVWWGGSLAWLICCYVIVVSPSFIYFYVIKYLYSVLSRLTIEAEAGMTVYVQCWRQVKSARYTGPLNVCKVCVCMGVCCSCYYSNSSDSNSCVSLLGELGAVCLQYTAWRPVSCSADLYALRLTARSGW